MTRIGKKAERRAQSFRKCKIGGEKTGSKKDALSLGYKAHKNAVANELRMFIGKVKG